MEIDWLLFDGLVTFAPISAYLPAKARPADES